MMAFHPEATGGGLWLIVGSPTLELGNDLAQGFHRSRVKVACLHVFAGFGCGGRRIAGTVHENSGD
ncbi:MAG: hypothetical protein ACPG6K_07945 [Pseudohongiellaceae bacterium]